MYLEPNQDRINTVNPKLNYLFILVQINGCRMYDLYVYSNSKYTKNKF